MYKEQDLLSINVNFMTFQAYYCNIDFKIYSLFYEQEIQKTMWVKYDFM